MVEMEVRVAEATAAVTICIGTASHWSNALIFLKFCLSLYFSKELKTKEETTVRRAGCKTAIRFIPRAAGFLQK